MSPHPRNLSTTLSQGAPSEFAQTSSGSDKILFLSPHDHTRVPAKTISGKRSRSTVAPILPQSPIPNAMQESASSSLAPLRSPPPARLPHPSAKEWSCRWSTTRSPPIQMKLGSLSSASSYRGTCPHLPLTNHSLTLSQENTIKSRIGFPISARKMLVTHAKAHNLLSLLISKPPCAR